MNQKADCYPSGFIDGVNSNVNKDPNTCHKKVIKSNTKEERFNNEIACTCPWKIRDMCRAINCLCKIENCAVYKMLQNKGNI